MPSAPLCSAAAVSLRGRVALMDPPDLSRSHVHLREGPLRFVADGGQVRRVRVRPALTRSQVFVDDGLDLIVVYSDGAFKAFSLLSGQSCMTVQ